MTDIAPKLFQKIIKKGLTATLFTASTAALMLGSSSGALGAATQITGPAAQFTTGVGFTPAAAFAGGDLQYAGGNGFTVNADAAVNITSIDVNGTAPDLFTVNENISLGSVSDVVGGGTAFPVTVNDTFNLILTGTAGAIGKADTYDMLGAITLAGTGGTLTITAADGAVITLANTIDGVAPGEGVLTVNTPATFNAAIGGVAPLSAMTFNNGAGLTTTVALSATNVTIGQDGGGNASVVQTGAINGAVNFANAGQLTAAGLITGNVTFAAAGTLNAPAGIDGNLTVSSGGQVAAATGNVTGIAILQADAGNVAIQDALNAANPVSVAGGTLNLRNAAQNMTITGGTVNQTGTIGGNLNVSGGGNLAGDAAVTDVTGTVTLQADAGTVTIQNAGGNVAVAGGILAIVDAGANMTITDGTVNQTGIIAGDLEMSNAAVLNGTAGTTNVGGTVLLDNGFTGTATINNATGVVTVQGGTLTLNDAAAGINFAGNAAARTTVNVIGGGNVADVDNTTGADFKGTLKFLGAGDANDIGTTNPLASVLINAGAVNLSGTQINVEIIELVDNAAILNLTNAAAVVTGDIDFTGSTGTANIAAGATIDGNINNIDAVNNNGTINFLGNGIITGFVALDNVGWALSKIQTINIKGAVGTNVQLQKSIGVENLVFNNAAGAGTVTVSSDLNADNVDFGNGGTLTFNSGAESNFIGTITNGANAILNINNVTQLTAYDPSIGSVKTITLGAGKNTFLIDTSAGNVTLLANAGQAITFTDANSNLGFINENNAAAGTVQLAADLKSSGIGQNNLGFFGGETAAKVLNVTSDAVGTVRNIGVVGNTFNNLYITGNVTTKDLDLSKVVTLNILAGSVFEDKNNTAASTATIIIGDANAAFNVPNTGAATYVIDAQGGNVAIPATTVITFADAAANLTLRNSAAGNGTITLNAAIDPGAPNKGILTIDSGANAGKIILANGGAGSYGTANNTLQQLSFAGNGTFQIDTPIFAAAYNLSIPAITYGADINGNLTFGAATQLTQNGNINGNVDFQNNAAAITLAAGKNITGGVTSSNGVNGTIIASGASNIGSVNNIAMLKVGAGAVSIGAGGNVTITEIQGNGTNLLTLPANFNLTGGINLTGGQALKLSFTNGGSVSGNIGTAANPVGDITTTGTTKFGGSVVAKGAMTFAGTTSFAKDFTNTGAASFAGTTSFAGTFNNQGAVTLAKSSINNFAGNVTATSFAADGATLNFSNNLAFNSDITGNGTTINLGSSQLTYTGKGSFTGALNLNTNYDPAASANGNIVIAQGSTLDLSQVSNLALNITVPNNININNIAANTQYAIISAQASGGLNPVPAGNINLNVTGGQNPFIRYTVDPTSLTLYVTDIAKEVVQQEISSSGVLSSVPDSIKNDYLTLVNAPKGSDAYQVVNILSQLTPAQKVEVIEDLTLNVVRPGEGVSAVNTQAVIGNILGNLTTLSNRVQVANNVVGVAAGDESGEMELGAWINPFIGNATQKMRKNVSGYKADSSGGTIGFDGMVSDDLVLGLAYTRADTNIKLKNNKTGDKNKVNSNIYSLYGLYNLSDISLFVEGIASYGDNRVKTRSQRATAVAQNTIGYQTAIGKYKSQSYTGQIMIGYNYGLPETVSTMPLVVTPLAGLRYSNIHDKGYKETGTTYQNLIVKGKNYTTFDGMLGARLSSSINTGEVTLIPELYAMLDYGFKNKTPAIDARLQGMAAPFSTTSFKPSKTSFDLGAGVTIKHNMMEYGINYDANIASKYFAQQGSLKVRVNF